MYAPGRPIKFYKQVQSLIHEVFTKILLKALKEKVEIKGYK